MKALIYVTDGQGINRVTDEKGKEIDYELIYED